MITDSDDELKTPATSTPNCPNCEGNNVMGYDGMLYEVDWAFEKVECSDCGTTFYIVWTRSGEILDVEVPERTCR